MAANAIRGAGASHAVVLREPVQESPPPRESHTARGLPTPYRRNLIFPLVTRGPRDSRASDSHGSIAGTRASSVYQLHSTIREAISADLPGEKAGPSRSRQACVLPPKGPGSPGLTCS